MRVWAGAAPRASHSHAIDSQDSALCQQCGVEETVDHFLWHCPIHEQARLVSLIWWTTLPPAASQTVIYPRDESASFVGDWKRVCRWAITVLSRRRGQYGPEGEFEGEDDDAQPTQSEISVKTGKGHVLVSVGGLGYSFCAKCFVARKSRDARFVFAKPCSRLDLTDNVRILEGDYVKDDDHVARMRLARWKTSSIRPRLACARCHKEQWAIANFRVPCVAS